MPQKPEKLWDLHSHVTSYVMPTLMLCQSLLQKTPSKARVLKRIAAIQPNPKVRRDKDYYYFGCAYIKKHPSELKLNPLHANLHHRFVRHTDKFRSLLNKLNPEDETNFDLNKVAAIAKEFMKGFAGCTRQELKREVEAACRLLRADSGSDGMLNGSRASAKRTRKEAVAAQSDSAHGTLTVPQLAEEWQCSRSKIYTLINNGELQAVNTSSGKGKRRRYLINRSAIEQFEQKRTQGPAAAKAPRKQRRQKSDGITEYFK